MLNPDRLPPDYTERLHLILQEAWRVLKSQFLDGRHPVHTEAPFQHYFAQIISSLGSLYCTGREDVFTLDLEKTCVGTSGGREFIDITCEFQAQKVSCAVELKFKTAKQAAQNNGRIDAYFDLEALERACGHHGYTFGKFYMITDSSSYVNQSAKGVGTVFSTHDGATTEAGKSFAYTESGGRRDVVVTLSNSYTFQWEKIGEWYFLELNVPHPKHKLSSNEIEAGTSLI